MEELQYPLGRFEFENADATAAAREAWIRSIEALPAQLRRAVEPLSPEQLQTPYRPGGWTVLQVTHHLADSHMNGFIRHKLTLTEDEPVIKPYQETRWAELPDTLNWPVESTLVLLAELHRRWGYLLRSLGPADFERIYHHPESGVHTLTKSLAQYAWHSRHHLAHITRLIERSDWK